MVDKSLNIAKVLAVALKDKSAFESLKNKFQPSDFPEDYRDFVKILYDLGDKRASITKDVLRDYLNSKLTSSSIAVAVQKVFNECQIVPVEASEFPFYFEELKKARASSILSTALTAMDENQNPVLVKGKEVPSITSLIQKKQPMEAVQLLKEAVVKIENLTSTDPIIRVNMKDRWQDKIQEYEERKTNKEKAVGLLTGLGPLDDTTRGIHPGEMFLVAGRPGAGKSVVLVNIAKHMVRNGVNVLLFSLEMPYDQYEWRFLSCYGGLNHKRMLLGALNTDEENKLRRTLRQFGEIQNNLEIIDFPNVSSFRIEAELTRALNRFTPDVVIVDYLGIMKPNDKKSAADWETQGKIAEELRQVARLYKIPTISAVQLNRSKDKTANSDRLSRSDIIAQTADAIIMINDKQDEDALSDQMKMTVIKNRKGESDYEFEMYKNFETITIENLPTYKSSLESLMSGS